MTDARWKQLGGAAGLGYVLVAVGAASLTGEPPAPGASSAEVRDFVLANRTELMTQGWLYGLGAALMLWFAFAVRQVLREAAAERHLGDLFFVGTAAIAALLVVAMAIQIVVAMSAAHLTAGAVRVVGVDFGLILLGLAGFIVATTAVAYAMCVLTDGALPRWTGWLALVAAAVNLAGTLGIFVHGGPFSIEGVVTAWLPGLSVVLWYLGVAVAMLRMGRRQPR